MPSSHYTPSIGVTKVPSFPLQFEAAVDGKSLACTPVEFFGPYGEIRNSLHASGFFYRHAARVFFVTARHVLSGTNAFTNANISPDGFRPNRIRVRPTSYIGSVSHRFTETVSLEVRDQDGTPRWLEDPFFDELKTDIAALEVKHPQAESIMCINQGADEQLLAYVGFDVFALGYPLPSYAEPFMPVWRRGSLATEPSQPVDDKPIFLCDIATSAGMSGSPIIQRWHGPAPIKENGAITMNISSIVSSRFVGVYGGRLTSGTKLDGAFVGYGWYANRIPIILDTAS